MKLELFRGTILNRKILFRNKNTNFYYRNIVESQKAKGSTDISRPVQDSLRHTAHGSPFGPSWGSPSCLRPLSPSDEVTLRGKVI